MNALGAVVGVVLLLVAFTQEMSPGVADNVAVAIVGGICLCLAVWSFMGGSNDC